MQIREFQVEAWMNAHEDRCRYNLAETCVRSLSVEEILALSGRREEILAELTGLRLTYGPILGSLRLRSLIAALLTTRSAEDVIVTHGAIGANALVYHALVEPGDRVVSVLPSYQQHSSIPESLGAEVAVTFLREKHNWTLDLDELAQLVRPGTKLLTLTNPNNPTGALLDRPTLEQVVAIARSAGARVIADEVYRGLDQDGTGTTVSVADLDETAVSIGSMSKAFSMAGVRLGWIVAPPDVRASVSIHRDYHTISVGMIDDLLASVALEAREAVFERNRELTRTNLGIVHEWIAERSDISYVKPESGTTTLLRYAHPIQSYEFTTRLLDEQGVLLTPGAAFGVEGTVRLGYADDTTTLRQGLALLGEFLDRLTEEQLPEGQR